tara:strand:- start:339 stop:596 length:258 start_codon:yes stop_codon:yes gene_type:complete
MYLFGVKTMNNKKPTYKISATQTAEAWNFSVKTTRQAFWKMVEQGEEADIFDLVFGELTIEQCKRINKLIDPKIWTELYLQEHDK